MLDAPKHLDRIPSCLVRGSVRGWHILLLYSLIFLSVVVLSAKVSQGLPPDVRLAWRMLLAQGVTAFLVVAITLTVPELRESLARLYAWREVGLDTADVLIYLGLIIAWSLGAHPLLLLYPLMNWDPLLFSTFGFTEHFVSPSGIAGLFMLLSISFVAPFAEELVFRGYLMNLWSHRWGAAAGIVMSSAAFGLAHLQFALFAGVAGVFLCLVYLRFGTLWQGTLLHSLANIVCGPFGLARLLLEKSRPEISSLSSWIPQLVLAVVFFPLLYLFWRRFRPAI